MKEYLKRIEVKMRKEVVNRLHELMLKNDDIIVLTGDLGFGTLDKIRDNFPDRFYNVGASEQAMSDIAVGLSLAGKIPVTYTITPFYYRCFETLRTYINHESIKVIMLGSGRDDDYSIDGFSHYASDDFALLNNFRNIQKVWPPDADTAKDVLEEAVNGDKPYYINLRK